MKTFSLPTTKLLVAVLFLLPGCEVDNDENLLNDGIALSEKISEVVDIYMKRTLGSIPGEHVEYDAAKELLSTDLAAEFTTPMFIPTSYCVQDGPSDVRIADTTLNDQNNWVNVVVEGTYGGDWEKMWGFAVAPVEDDHWVIHNIACLASS